jgi:GTPase
VSRNLPRITIIGVANTGKSTLFNRLIGRRKALVHNQPGMTRDIFSARMTLNDRLYSLQDSGGFFAGSDIITTEVNRKIFREAERSDLIIFLFDGKRDLLGYEKDLFLDIQRLHRKMIVVVNKVDNPENYLLPADYYGLKRDFIFISADHDIGVDDLTSRIASELAGADPESEADAEPDTRLSIIGKPNVGKSSIINRLLNDEAVIVSPLPGTTRDSIDLEIQRNRERFILVDNAGIRKLQKLKENTESAAVIRAEKSMTNADVIIFVVDISARIDQTDLLIASKIIDSCRPVLIAANKTDSVRDQQSLSAMTEAIHRRFRDLYFAPVIPISAMTGKNIFAMFDRAVAIDRRLKRRLKTSDLNDLLPKLMAEKKYMTDRDTIFHPKFINIESRKPFFVRFFGRIHGHLKASDERHLKKRISEELQLEGVPIFFKVVSQG